VSFDFPWALLLLPLIYWVKKNGYKSSIVPFAPIAWLHGKFPTTSFKEKMTKYSELVLYISLVLGLSGPNILMNRESIQLEGIDLAITLDLSASMQAADFLPNRLEAMKKLVIEYLDGLRGNRTGIIVFSGKVFLHYPFTNNKTALQKAVDGIHFQTIDHNKAGGTNIGDAILFSREELNRIKIDTREQAILLITDGENTGGADPILAAKSALQSGIHIYIVGIAGAEPIPVFESDGDPFIGADGKQVVTSLNDVSLKEIASTGGGVYYRAKEGESLKSILKEIAEIEKHPLEMKTVKEKISLSFGIYIITLLSFFIFIFGTSIWVRSPIR